MKIRLGALAAAAVFIVGCDTATSPRDEAAAMLAFNQAATVDVATGVPRGPFMNRELPEAIRLTDAQKTAIKALHDAFNAAHATQFAQLRTIHQDARTALKAGATRAEVGAILDKGQPIIDAMKVDFDALRVKVEALLTAEQKAWFAEHRRADGGPLGVRHMGGMMNRGQMPGRP